MLWWTLGAGCGVRWVRHVINTVMDTGLRKAVSGGTTTVVWCVAVLCLGAPAIHMAGPAHRPLLTCQYVHTGTSSHQILNPPPLFRPSFCVSVLGLAIYTRNSVALRNTV